MALTSVVAMTGGPALSQTSDAAQYPGRLIEGCSGSGYIDVIKWRSGNDLAVGRATAGPDGP